MNWTFDPRRVPDFIRVTLSGLFDKEHFGSMLDELAALEYFDTGCRLLFDDTALELGQMTDRDLLEASNVFIHGNKVLAYSKVAILTTPEAFHVGRKFERITEYGSRAIMRIFDDEKLALDWLLGGVTAAQTSIS